MTSAYEVILRARRDEIEARRVAGARPEARSHADVIPMILYIDPARVSSDLREVPEVVRRRFLSRPFHQVGEVDPEDLSALSFLEPWQRKQFAEVGFTFLALPGASIQENPRGRRLLDNVEMKLRETLALWVWALMPSIDSLAASIPETGGSASPGLSFLAQRAPWLTRMADESLARRPDKDADVNAADQINTLHGLIARLSDEGRKVRITMRGADGATRECSGVTLQEVYRASAITLLRDPQGRSGVKTRVMAHAGLLETLAKAGLAGSAVFSAQVSETRAFQQGMDALGGQGPVRTLRDKGGKRLRNAAAKVVRSTQAPHYVQAPGNGAAITLSPHEMAIAAFFAGVDPYVFCGQHVIFAEDVLSAKALGDWMLGRRIVAQHELAPIMALLEQGQQNDPFLTGWEQQLAEMRDAVEASGELIALLNGG